MTNISSPADHISCLRKTASIPLVKKQGTDWIKKEIEFVNARILKLGGKAPRLHNWVAKLKICLYQLEYNVHIQ